MNNSQISTSLLHVIYGLKSIENMLQEKLNFTDTVNTPQANWWPVMSHSLPDGAKTNEVSPQLIYCFTFPAFKLPFDIVVAMQGNAILSHKYA